MDEEVESNTWRGRWLVVCGTIVCLLGLTMLALPSYLVERQYGSSAVFRSDGIGPEVTDEQLAYVAWELELANRWGVEETEAKERLRDAVRVVAGEQDRTWNVEVRLPSALDAWMVAERLVESLIHPKAYALHEELEGLIDKHEEAVEERSFRQVLAGGPDVGGPPANPTKDAKANLEEARARVDALSEARQELSGRIQEEEEKMRAANEGLELLSEPTESRQPYQRPTQWAALLGRVLFLGLEALGVFLIVRGFGNSPRQVKREVRPVDY
ncbi:MAG: hypothetical protein AAGI48_14485 [Verrucomicrobiota bacterium]